MQTGQENLFGPPIPPPAPDFDAQLGAQSPADSSQIPGQEGPPLPPQQTTEQPLPVLSQPDSGGVQTRIQSLRPNWTPEQYQKANETVNSITDPDKQSRLRLKIKEYEDSNNAASKSAGGTLVRPATTSLPTEVDFSKSDGFIDKVTNWADTRFVYEPPVDWVKNKLRENPELLQQLGLSNYGPDDIEKITENSTAYAAVSDYKWKEAVERAKKDGLKMVRYSKLNWGDDAVRKAVGGFLNAANSAVMGLDDVMLGVPGYVVSNVIDAVSGSGGTTVEVGEDGYPVAKFSQGEATQAFESEKEFQRDKGILSLPGIAGLVGGGSMRAPATKVAAEISERLGYNAITDAAKKATSEGVKRTVADKAKDVGKKALIGGVAGGAAGGVQAGGMEATEQLLGSKEIDPTAIAEAAGTGTVLGTALGTALDPLAQLAGKVSSSIKTLPRYSSLRQGERGGITTDPVFGVSGPEELKTAVSQSAQGKGAPSDILAEKAAPKMVATLDEKIRVNAETTKKNLENYFQSPEGQTPHPVTGNVDPTGKKAEGPVDVILSYLGKGIVKRPTGGERDIDPKQAAALRQRLGNLVDRVDVPESEAARLAQEHDGYILDSDQADLILKGPDKTQVGGAAMGAAGLGLAGASDSEDENSGAQAAAAGLLGVGAALATKNPAQRQQAMDSIAQRGEKLVNAIFGRRTQGRLGETFKDLIPTRSLDVIKNEPLRRFGERLQHGPFSDIPEFIDKMSDDISKKGFAYADGNFNVGDKLVVVDDADVNLVNNYFKEKANLYENKNYSVKSLNELEAKYQNINPSLVDINPLYQQVVSKTEYNQFVDTVKHNFQINQKTKGLTKGLPEFDVDTLPEFKEDRNAEVYEIGDRAWKNLDEKEQSAVEYWLFNDYEQVRNYQSTGKLPDPTPGDKNKGSRVKEMSDTLQKAAEKMTVYKPTKWGPLYRGVDLPPEAIQELMVNGTYTVRGNMSSSLSTDTAKGFMGADRPGSVLFIFDDVDAGAVLAGKNKTEVEILIPNGGKYEVTDRKRTKGGALVVHLSQQAETPKDDLLSMGALAALMYAGANSDSDAAKGAAGVGAAALIGKGKGRGNFRQNRAANGEKMKTVLIPQKLNAEQLNAAEQEIARSLGYSRSSEGRDDPVLKSIERSFKNVRDRFKSNEFTPDVAKLDDGTEVKGLSALQRKHHEAANELEAARKSTGGSAERMHQKVSRYTGQAQGELLNERELRKLAEESGVLKELEQASASQVYQALQGQANMGGALNILGSPGAIADAAFMHLIDPLARAANGAPVHPYQRNTELDKISRELFKGTGGSPAKYTRQIKEKSEEDEKKEKRK